MANKTLFHRLTNLLPKADARNQAGGPAYQLSPRHALAQYAVTGCLNSTFYANANEQLQLVLDLCSRVEPDWIARVAVYSRQYGYMKDMPALLTAVLAARDRKLCERVFPRVIDNAKMLRNFVQMVRSGVTGRKSLGSAPKRLVREWIAKRTAEDLFRDSVGQSPSMVDILRLVHPKPKSPAYEALFGYMLNKPYETEKLPALVRHYEEFKSGERLDVPQVPFQMLTAIGASKHEWREIARRAPWQMTRMNLNTFARNGVFEDAELTKLIAERLRNPEAVRNARVFPYQLMAAWAQSEAQAPLVIREALELAMETAVMNAPAIQGKVYVCLDVSGSMASPVTGHRQGSTTAVRAVDVAALMAATILRRNPQAEILPFDTGLVKLNLDPKDRVMVNAAKLAAVGGGGTDCSKPLRELNKRQAKGDVVLYVSDNESWVDAGRNRGTATLEQWNYFRSRNRYAKLVCIDVQPYATTQAADRADILNVGGFSDHVFDVVSQFVEGRLDEDHWLRVIKNVKL